MPYFKVRVIEQCAHEFFVEAENEDAVSEMDVDEHFADLCARDEGFQHVERRDIEEIDEVDEDEADTIHISLLED